MRYTKKPVTINAIQWDGENVSEIMRFLQNNEGQMTANTKVNFDLTAKPIRLLIHTLESTSDPLEASIGDFVIIGIKGEVYPCKSDIFADSYDLAEGQTA